MTNWCLIPNLALYLIASLFYLAQGKRFWLAPAAKTLVLFGALLHLVYLLYLGFLKEFSTLSFIAFGLVVLFLWFLRRLPSPGLGSFFLPLATILFIFSLGTSKTPTLFEKLFWLTGLHVVLAVLALIFMIGNLILGAAFFIHERSLKQKKWEALSISLPPLLPNEQKALVWLRIGFVFLTLVLLTGSMLAVKRPLAFPWEVFHVALSLLAWALYVYVLNRPWAGPEGRKILLLSLVGLVSLGGAYLWT